MPLRILLSHAHDEAKLAEAWKALLEDISQGAIEPWFSSDGGTTGGMTIGAQWRDTLRGKLQNSNYALAILSPFSRDRPWIIYECGIMSGLQQSKATEDFGGGVIPCIYSMETAELANPLSSFDSYKGDDRDDVENICARLMSSAGLTPKRTLWTQPLDEYMAKVAAHRPRHARHPEEVTLWRTRIEAFIQSGRTGEVRAMRSRMYVTFASPFVPTEALLHDLLSKVMLDERHYEECMQETHYALQIAPDDIELLHRKALAACHLGNKKDALDAVEHIKRIEPGLAQNPEIAGVEGRIFREAWQNGHSPEDLTAARDAYTRACEADASDYYCALNAASLALAASDIVEAERLFMKAQGAVDVSRERGPVSFWSDFSAGEIALGRGQIPVAEAEFEKGLLRTPPPRSRDRDSAVNGVRRIASLKGYGLPEIARILKILGP